MPGNYAKGNITLKTGAQYCLYKPPHCKSPIIYKTINKCIKTIIKRCHVLILFAIPTHFTRGQCCLIANNIAGVCKLCK